MDTEFVLITNELTLRSAQSVFWSGVVAKRDL